MLVFRLCRRDCFLQVAWALEVLFHDWICCRWWSDVFRAVPEISFIEYTNSIVARYLVSVTFVPPSDCIVTIDACFLWPGCCWVDGCCWHSSCRWARGGGGGRGSSVPVGILVVAPPEVVAFPAGIPQAPPPKEELPENPKWERRDVMMPTKNE